MAESERIDLDTFYSCPPLDVWRRVLGERMHYHHGIWDGERELGCRAGQRRPQSGSPRRPGRHGRWTSAAAGADPRACSPTGSAAPCSASPSAGRRRPTVRAAASTFGTWISTTRSPTAPGRSGWWMESLEHLEEPEQALARLRPRCEKLVIRVNTCEAAPRRLFAGSMPMRSARFYRGRARSRRMEGDTSFQPPARICCAARSNGWVGLRAAGIVCAGRSAPARTVGLLGVLHDQTVDVCQLPARRHRRRVSGTSPGTSGEGVNRGLRLVTA